MKTLSDREIRVGHMKGSHVYVHITNFHGYTISVCLTEQETRSVIEMLQNELHLIEDEGEEGRQ